MVLGGYMLSAVGRAMRFAVGARRSSETTSTSDHSFALVRPQMCPQLRCAKAALEACARKPLHESRAEDCSQRSRRSPNTHTLSLGGLACLLVPYKPLASRRGAAVVLSNYSKQRLQTLRHSSYLDHY